MAAEDQIAREYERRGYQVAARRYRSIAGEIDLVLRQGDMVIFAEVKKSRSFDQALARLSRRQMRRIYKSAEIFVDGEPARSLTERRFDIALVNEIGEIQIMEGAMVDW